MRNKFPWVTVVLAACAVGVGLGFSFLIQVFLPSYKNTVVTVSDVPEINRLLYVEDTDELIIYPWDQFSVSEGLTLQEYYQELYTDGKLGNISVEKEFPELEKEVFQGLDDCMNGLLFTSNEGLENWPDFGSYLRVCPDKSTERAWIFLNEVPVRSGSGYDCLLDAAWSGGLDSCVYFHVYKKDPVPLQDSTVQAANRYLDDIFGKNWTDPYPYGIYGQNFVDQMPVQDDPILLWLKYVRDYTQLDAVMLALTVRADRCERIVYRDEILLVYSFDSQRRLVLFYDPFLNKITGFSSNL